MVFKSIKRIKEALPDLIHIVMFYDEGTIFQTTFEHPINIPQLGENLSEGLRHFEKLFEITQIITKQYIKLIYETADYVIIILKLGEHSNIALFFHKGEEIPKISTIRRYLYRIEELIDTDKLELDIYALEELNRKLNELEKELQANLETIEKLISEISNFDLEIENIKEKAIDDWEGKIKNIENEKQNILSEINLFLGENKKIEQKIEEKTSEITALKEKISKLEKEKFEKKFLE